MDFFYIRHHYQSIMRSSSLRGEVFALVILAILLGGSVSQTYSMLDVYAISLSEFFGRSEVSYDLILAIYIFLDLSIRLVFRRPLPKLKYYVLIKNKPQAISWQYLLTSLFGIVPFVLVITMLIVASKANSWMGKEAMVAIIIWWFANHYIALNAQFSKVWVKNAVAGTLVLTLLLEFFLQIGIASTILKPYVGLSLFIVGIVLTYSNVKRLIEKREFVGKSENAE
ncbi:MAG: hypothetical protein AAFY41_02825, partial [Bacteroidota bacterium]